VLVYRSELLRTFSKGPRSSPHPANRWRRKDLTKAAQQAYPGYQVIEVWQPKNPNQAAEIR